MDYIRFPAGSLLASFGLERHRSALFSRGQIELAATNTQDYSGRRSGVLVRVGHPPQSSSLLPSESSSDNNNYDETRLLIKRWGQDESLRNHEERVIDLRFKREVDKDGKQVERISSLKIFGQSISLNGPRLPKAARNIQKAIKAIVEIIENKESKPDIEAIFKELGVGQSHKSARKAFIDFAKSRDEDGHEKPSQKVTPRKRRRRITYPAYYLPTMLGLPIPESGKNIIDARFDNVTNTKDGSRHDIYYEYKASVIPGGKGHSLTHSAFCQQQGDKQGPTIIYSITTSPSTSSNKELVIDEFSLYGSPVDLNDEKAIARAMETVRLHNRAIDNQNYSLGHNGQELLSNILDRTKVVNFLFKDTAKNVPSFADGGRSSFIILGGENQSQATVDASRENSIGANSAAIEQAGLNKHGEFRKYAVLVDDGIGFLDRKSSGYDHWRTDLNYYLPHKGDSKWYKPEVETLCIVFTHGHKDHFDLDHHYDMPPLIMDRYLKEWAKLEIKARNDLSQAEKNTLISKIYEIDPEKDITPDNAVIYLENFNRRRDLSKTQKEKIRQKFEVIDPSQYPKPEVKAQKTTTKIGETIIEQWTEAYISPKQKGGFAYAPYIRVYKAGAPEAAYEMRLNHVSHSYPNLMVDIRTQSGHTYGITGDFKMSKKNYIGRATDPYWIKATKRDLLLMETTGADRPGRTAEYSELESHYAELFYEQAKTGKAIKAVAMPGDVNTFFAMINAVKRARKKIIQEKPNSRLLSYFSVDGAGLQRLTRILNSYLSSNGKFGLKNYMNQEDSTYAAVNFYTRASEAVKDKMYTGDPSLFLAVTGTQGEPTSVAARVAEDEVDRLRLRKSDTVIFTKNAIPTGKNAQRRYAMKKNIEQRTGALVILPEDYTKDNPGKFIALSGHGANEELREMASLSNADFIALTHGDDKKFASMTTDLQAQKIQVLDMSSQDRFGANRGETIHWIGQVPERRNLVTEIYPGASFWNAQGTDTIAIDVPTMLRGPVGHKMQIIEDISRNGGASLEKLIDSPAANDSYLPWKNLLPPAIGIEKYSNNTTFVLNDNIKVIKSIDTEGTGTTGEGAKIFSFGMHRRDPQSGEEIDNTHYKMALGLHDIFSIYAALVTYTDPKSISEGDPPHIFASKVNNALADNDFDPKDKQSRALVIGHNVTGYDAPLLQKTLLQNGIKFSRPFQNAQNILFDTRHFARAVHAFMPGLIKVRKNQKTGLGDFSLQGLCEANGLEYQDLHHALADTYPAYDLFNFLKKKLKDANRIDIYHQILMNSDYKGREMIDDIVGKKLRPGAPRPPFSYVSSKATRPYPCIGVVVGTELKASSGKTLIVQNLKYKPEDYLDLSKNEILEMAKDPNCDVFETINIAKHPIIAPMSFAYKAEKIRRQHQKGKKPFVSNLPTTQQLAIKRSITLSQSPEKSVSAHSQQRRGKTSWDSLQTNTYQSRVISAFSEAFKRLIHRGKDTFSPPNEMVILKILASGQLKRSDNKDMKNFQIASTSLEMAGEIDINHIARIAVSFGVIHNPDLIGVAEESFYHRWSELKSYQRTAVYKKAKDILIAEGYATRYSASKEMEKVKQNVKTAVDNVRRGRSLRVFAPATSRHISLARLEKQFRELDDNPDLYERFVGESKERQSILKKWKKYAKLIRDNDELNKHNHQDPNRIYQKYSPKRHDIGPYAAKG